MHTCMKTNKHIKSQSKDCTKRKKRWQKITCAQKVVLCDQPMKSKLNVFANDNFKLFELKAWNSTVEAIVFYILASQNMLPKVVIFPMLTFKLHGIGIIMI